MISERKKEYDKKYISENLKAIRIQKKLLERIKNIKDKNLSYTKFIEFLLNKAGF